MSLINYSVLPFYDSKDEQLCRRKYAYGEVYPLYVAKGKVLPFQFVVPSTGNTISSVSLVNFNTDTSVTITSSITIRKLSFSNYEVFVFLGGTVYGSMTVGRWYLQIQTNHDAYYSEVFTAVDDITPYLKIQWWDEQDLVIRDSRIVYEVASNITFKNEVYFDTALGMPEYEFEEEGETRDGLWFPEKMISEKTYKFSFLAPEYLLDAMRFIRMSDHIKITDWMNDTYDADTFLLTPKWQSPGMLAAVDAEFQTAAVAKKIGRV